MDKSITWDICRLCLVEEQKKPQTNDTVAPMFHIFEMDKMLPKQIVECSGITMKPNDNLPEKICEKCLTMVKCAVNFRKTCQASDIYLQSILQSIKLDSLPDEIISNECMSNYNIESKIEDSDALNVVKQSKTLNRQATHSDKTTAKSRKESSSIEINTNSADMINHKDDDNLFDIVEEKELSDYSRSSVNQVLTNAKELSKILDDNSEENEESQIDATSKERSHNQDLVTIELKIECSDSEESDEAGLSNLKETYYDYLKNNIKENISHQKGNKQNFDVEELIEILEHEDENSESMNFEIETQEEILEDLKFDMDENQAQLSSPVTTKEYEDVIIEAKEENSSSAELNYIQTEHVIGEYLIDGNSGDASQENTAMLAMSPKMSISISNKIQTQPNDNKTSAVSKSSLGGPGCQLWICDLCGNQFTSRQLLNDHLKIHRQEKKHACELCVKRFITACNLQAHMRIHTGEKPFECQYCGRLFSDRSSHLRHERIHTKEKPFQCKQCGKAFSLATTLKTHLVVHTGERSYRCDICAKSFKLPHQLKAHNKSWAHKAEVVITKKKKTE